MPNLVIEKVTRPTDKEYQKKLNLIIKEIKKSGMVNKKLIEKKCGCVYYNIIYPEGDESRLYIGYCDHHLEKELEE